MSYIPKTTGTIYDLDFTTVTPDAGMADGATKSLNGLTWTYRKGANTAATIDSNGLNVTFSGIAGADSIFSFLMSDLGLDLFGSRYRIWVYHELPTTPVGEDAYIGCLPCGSQSAATGTNAFGMYSYDVAGVRSTQTFKLLGGDIISTDAAFNTGKDVFVLDNDGGVFTTRKGAYSAGFPSVASCAVQVSAPILPSLLNGATTGLTTPWYIDLYATNSGYVATPVTVRFKRVKIELL